MSLKKQAISGVKWNFVQQFSVQIINFGVQVILARLLMPEMFGLIAMIIVFISIGQSLMDSGMTSSLIRTNNPSQLDYSTVFMTNMFMSVLIYISTYLLAPYIATFYNQNILIDIIRLFALTFIINALVAVHIAKLTKEMNFQLQMKLQIPSVIISGIVGVTLAYMGYGVWSLVWMNLTRSFLFALQAWFFINWKPSLLFDKERFKYHFNFGYKLTLAGLIDTIYNDAYRIVIGKFFNPAAVGYFNHAENMRLFPVNQISSVMGKVTYPFFSNINNDDRLKRAYQLSVKLVTLVVTPLMLILIIVAEEGFLLMFGEKWLPSVPYFQILAIASIVRPLSTYNLNILKVKNRSDLFLRISIIKKVIGVIALVIGLQFGVMGLVISLTIVSLIWAVMNMIYCGRFIKYSMTEQLKDIVPITLIAIIAMLCSYLLKNYLSTFIDSRLFLISIVTTFYMLVYMPLVYLIDKKLLSIVRGLVINK